MRSDQILFGKKFGHDGRFNTFGNLGIAILTAPTQLFSQNDVLTYGVAGIFRINKQFSIAGEVNGRANTRPGNGPLGTESQAEARLGMQIRASGLRFDFAGIKGLTSFSPNSGFHSRCHLRHSFRFRTRSIGLGFAPARQIKASL